MNTLIPQSSATQKAAKILCQQKKAVRQRYPYAYLIFSVSFMHHNSSFTIIISKSRLYVPKLNQNNQLAKPAQN
mgnify:FL=1